MSDDLLCLYAEAKSQRDTAAARVDECEAWSAANPHDGWLLIELDRRREEHGYLVAEVEHLERCIAWSSADDWTGDRLLDPPAVDLFGRSEFTKEDAA